MAILALATSGPHGEVGLETGPGRVAVIHLGRGAARGRGLLAAIRTLLDSEGLGLEALAGVAVDVGPGSFTGVRVGVTAAKTLAWARSIPVLGVQSLAAIARGAPPNREVLAIRDAGRGTLYRAAFGKLENDCRPVLLPPAREPVAAALSHLGRRLAVGEEAPALVAAASSTGEALEIRAGAAAVLAEYRAMVARRRIRDPGGLGPASPHQLVPIYLQASAPEQRRAGERGGNPREKES